MSAEYEKTSLEVKEVDSLFNLSSYHLVNLFVKEAINSVFEECILQLNILRHLNMKNTIELDSDVVKYQTLEDRYTGIEDHSETRIPFMSTNYDKMVVDINTISNIIKQTSIEIRDHGTTKILERCNNALRNMMLDDEKLVEDETNNMKVIKDLRKQYHNETLDNMRTIEETNEKNKKLAFDVESAIVYGRLETKYFINWEIVRVEQNIIACKEREQHFWNISKEGRDKTELEKKCHHQFNKYIEEDRVNCLESINYWVQRYDNEIENREAEMLQMKTKLEGMTVTHQNVIAEHQKRQKEMAEWKAYKKEMHKKKAREADIKWASLVVQTWWRGIMTIKGIGPYKPKKHKKKNNDENNNKN
ncbi:uncharacterized protein LOC126891706 [Diabrotica virgifera virgifera]|uniref:Dynein regulatory complex protein 9 n=2 Tax=Diabrotica virgifera virgifera TaxID=50390 RepID=A0ABM5L3B1_DIAVI|nr:uncharacterized protein LOC126891706 [Diabrotica virgifera virgifera]